MFSRESGKCVLLVLSKIFNFGKYTFEQVYKNLSNKKVVFNERYVNLAFMEN